MWASSFNWQTYFWKLITRCWRIPYQQSKGVIASKMLVKRLSFVWDFASDGLVALSLQEHHPFWACLTAMIMLFPYTVLAMVLRPSGLYRTLGMVHPRLKEPLQRLAAKRALSAIIFACFACPGFAYIDIWLVASHLCAEPADPSLFHYLTLRQLMEVFFEANLQVSSASC